MKIYAPKYYSSFVCIADKCKHSCCVGWEIDIDEPTYDKYLNSEHPYIAGVCQSIDTCPSPHFVLSCDERCPHLNDQNLCKIILNAGEDYLCDICKEHPRFYNYTNQGKEAGLGMACEDACRIILESDDFDMMIEIGENDQVLSKYDYDSVDDRANIYKILKNPELNFVDKVKLLSEKYGISVNVESDREVMTSLEYLSEEDRHLFTASVLHSIDASLDHKLVRILAYFIYRHCSEAIDGDDFAASLSFSVFGAMLIGSISTEENICDIARIYSEEIEYSEDNVAKIKDMYF